ncbi:MAG: hypothetical protein WAW13_04935, partial [Minisyncoccia bacterium]
FSSPRNKNGRRKTSDQRVLIVDTFEYKRKNITSCRIRKHFLQLFPLMGIVAGIIFIYGKFVTLYPH